LQAGRIAAPAVVAAAGAMAAGAELRLAAGRFPLLDLPAAVTPIAAEIPLAVAGLPTELPEPLVAAGMALTEAGAAGREGLVEAWLEDPAGPEPVLGFWVRVAGGPVLEGGRAAIATPSRDEWTGAACPGCGGPAQVSVIAEESGEFMGGSPRSLVCGRCAGWWTFPRAICTWCGESDPRRLPSFVPDERRAVRIDGCETCSSYVKTFDLREPGGIELVPLVDDVATVSLDLWANDQGLTRHLVSFAGV
jgi:formate dehydrogenase formation protein